MFGHRRRQRAKRQRQSDRESDRTIHLAIRRDLAPYSMLRKVIPDDLGSPEPNAKSEPQEAEFRRAS